jgi:hypothetical protein
VNERPRLGVEESLLGLLVVLGRVLADREELLERADDAAAAQLLEEVLAETAGLRLVALGAERAVELGDPLLVPDRLRREVRAHELVEVFVVHDRARVRVPGRGERDVVAVLALLEVSGGVHRLAVAARQVRGEGLRAAEDVDGDRNRRAGGAALLHAREHGPQPLQLDRDLLHLEGRRVPEGR